MRPGAVAPGARSLGPRAPRRLPRAHPAARPAAECLPGRADRDRQGRGRRAQRRLDAGESAPLLGVPVAVKDNVDVAGELTRHGTGAVTTPAQRDSDAVRRPRASGAVIVGKTHLPELAPWANFTESQTYGPTRNPWNLDRSTGGSSDGTAALSAPLEAARPWAQRRPTLS
jgi:Asp-tRNA(Asn)/Glu-tRNA(Gln) amidotransferase A subunit family amidase